MNSFLISNNCSNFLKADVEKAKQNCNVDNLDDPDNFHLKARLLEYFLL
jgi:hypothetical protein